MVTGTDEHGEKIAAAAAKAGMKPKQHCDAVVASYHALWDQLDVKCDSFIRTTDPAHEALVAELLQRCYDAGDIYKANYEGFYCVDCEEYKDEADLDKAHNCPIHSRPCQQRSEENYFFRLSKYQAQIEALLEKDIGFLQPAARRNEVVSWVKSGLRDFSISRDASAMSWGIPLPWDPSHNTYVWFDALAGYLSALLPDGVHSSSGGFLEAAQAGGWPATHVIGKDILRFHAVYWPGILISAGLQQPRLVYGHGFLTARGAKMGKSMGNVVDPTVLVDAYGADAVRFYFLAEMEFGKDGDFNEERFCDKVNASLANDIGNLLNRTLGLLAKNCDEVLPIGAEDIPKSHPLRSLVPTQVAKAGKAYDRLAFHEAASAALALSSRGNLFINETTPWNAFKKGSSDDKEEAQAVLVAVLETARIVAVLLFPLMPSLSNRILAQLGISPQELQWQDAEWGGLQRDQQMAKAQPVFQRLEGQSVIQKPADPAN